MQNKLLLTGVIVAIIAILPACSKMGGPDEFSVLKNPPLIVPPDYHLSPPGDENDLSNAYTPQEIAKKALFGDGDN
ncbi:MAG: DUF3035 domain-containing protein [Emcibacter sp.]|nr:DUF3035 domain-containing protein [Emcibacter sp.]